MPSKNHSVPPQISQDQPASSIYVTARRQQCDQRLRRRLVALLPAAERARLRRLWQHLTATPTWATGVARLITRLLSWPAHSLRRLSLSQLLATALSAGLTAGMLTQPLIALAQEPAPVGDEFQVNSYTTGTQRGSVVASDADGDFVIVWTDSGTFGFPGSPSPDGSESGIFAQRYDKNGLPQGSQFQINTYTTGSQSSPTVAMDADGDFIVAWIDRAYTSQRDIYARRFTAEGTPKDTNEFRVNSYTTTFQDRPSVAMDANGDFVIVWEDSFYTNGLDGSKSGIYARRFTAQGSPKDNTEFRVNSYTTDSQEAPDVAMDQNGDFVIIWESDPFYENGQDGSLSGIYAQRFKADGTPQGSEFQVNTYTSGLQITPSVAMDDNGQFVAAWQSLRQDDDSLSFYARRFDTDGMAKDGSEFRVNTLTENYFTRPDLALDEDGDFVVTWMNGAPYGSPGPDGSSFGISARRYHADGLPQSSEFQVNTYTTGSQSSPSVAVDTEGDFVITWSSGHDGSQSGVFAQRYGLLAPRLSLTKDIDNLTPAPNQPLTYTLTIDNSGLLTATNGVLSDTLPEGLQFVGPVTIDGGSGSPGLPPLIATDLTIEPNGRITVTLPVKLSEAVSAGQGLTNTAAITSLEVTTPATGSVGITITLEDGQTVYLPVVLK